MTGGGERFPGREAARPGAVRLFPGQVLSVAVETMRRSRGASLWIVLSLSCAAAIFAGFRLPASGWEGEGRAGFLLDLLLSILLCVAALAAGAGGLAGDRISGFRDLAGSKPLPAAAYFLGRFGGLAARFSLAALLFSAAGGAVISLAGGGGAFGLFEEAERFEMKGIERSGRVPFLLPPGGTAAQWIFPPGAAGPGGGEGPPCGKALRFDLRVRHPRGRFLQAKAPVRIETFLGDKRLAGEDLEISGRKVFSLPLSIPAALSPGEPGRLVVRLSSRGGVNFVEASAASCRLLRRTAGPIAALLGAALSFLPLLWAVLALALFFSAFVREPSALFAASVLALAVLSGPSLQRSLRLVASGAAPSTASKTAGEEPEKAAPAPPGAGGLPAAENPPPAWLRKAAAAAERLLDLLPSPGGGGSPGPLSRGECPALGDIVLPYERTLPHLVILLLLGCIVSSWRRP